MRVGDREHRDDIRELMALPSFRRFLFRSTQLANIWQASTNGADDRNLAFFEGRRSLGFDLLADVEQGLPVSHPDGLPLMAVLAILREEAQPQAKETTRENPTSDPTSDLDDDDEPRRP